MRKRRIPVERYESYRYSERGFLQRGDTFRASHGPYYLTNDGTRVSMAAPGKYVFLTYCVQGSIEWLEAVPPGGGAYEMIYVGEETVESVKVPGMMRRPYKIRKLRTAAPVRKKVKEAINNG